MKGTNMKKIAMITLLVLATTACVNTLVIAASQQDVAERCACGKPKPPRK